MILGLAGGQTLAAVSRSQGCSVNTVKLWRDRFLEGRISGLFGRHPGKAVAEGTEQLEAPPYGLDLASQTGRGLHPLEFTQTGRCAGREPHESGPCLEQGGAATLSSPPFHGQR
jgi:hypothetical protein